MGGAATFDDPQLECDIVMKGGITSGVVYPGAVLSLARRYRFRSIGGTSAGAIAATVVAAAEHRRRQSGSGQSFEAVAALPDELASEARGRPFMFQLFQADRPTRPLFRAITGFMEHGKLGGLLRLPLAAWTSTLPALLVLVGSVLLSTVGDADAAFAVAGVAASVAIFVIGLVADLLRSLQGIVDNDFGMCRLGPGVGTEDEPALTGWLHQKIQSVSGAGEVLTFADLWGVPRTGSAEERHAELLRRSRSAKERDVDLQMVTTDLTHGRPIRLPVLYQPKEDRLEEEAGRLLFDPEELAAFFPPAVVEHLVACSEPSASAPERPGGGELRHFPIGPDLPVVVATRMSLSFPMLISAIPLWRLEYLPGGGERLQRVVFSDGGVTSNFPIHFFDSPLPTRPTFGLHLTGFGRHEAPDLEDPADCVEAPGAPGDRARETVLEIDTLGSFFGALKGAAQNWRDNAQAALPGFRDRIAHIKLDTTEGGLNLAMDPEVIRRINARGAYAGDELDRLFADPPAKHWNDHRFTRYRVTMGLIAQLLQRYHHGWSTPPAATDRVTTTYDERVVAGTEPPYRYTGDARDWALETTQTYLRLHEEAAEHPPLDADTPRPPSTLRAVPPV